METTLDIETSAKYFYDKQGVQYESLFDDDHAVRICDEYYLDNNFVRSLIRAYDSRYGATDSQKAWIHIMAVKATSVNASPVISFRQVVQIFAAALKAGKKSPVLVIPTDDNTFTFRLLGVMSQYQGDIKVMSHGTYLGRISIKDGQFTPGRGLTNIAKLDIESIAKQENLIEYMSTMGMKSGTCCFCGKTLTDDRSMDAGYGPECAKVHGLSWG